MMDYEKRKVCLIIFLCYYCIFKLNIIDVSFSLFLCQEEKKQEKLIFEKELEEKQREQAQFLVLNHSRKEDMLLSVRQVIMPTGYSTNIEAIR